MPRRSEPDEEDDFEDDDEYDPVDDAVAAVFEHPQVQGIIGKVSNTLDRFTSLIDQVSRGKIPRAPQAPPQEAPRGRAQPRPRQAPPPRPQPPPRPKFDPFVVMGFAPGTNLTEQLIKDRRRQLAKIFHADHAGNEESMKRVNMAADLLLQKIGAKRAP